MSTLAWINKLCSRHPSALRPTPVLATSTVATIRSAVRIDLPQNPRHLRGTAPRASRGIDHEEWSLGSAPVRSTPQLLLNECMELVRRRDLDGLIHLLDSREILAGIQPDVDRHELDFQELMEAMMLLGPSRQLMDSYAIRNLVLTTPASFQVLSTLSLPDRFIQRCAITSRFGEDCILTFTLNHVRKEPPTIIPERAPPPPSSQLLNALPHQSSAAGIATREAADLAEADQAADVAEAADLEGAAEAADRAKAADLADQTADIAEAADLEGAAEAAEAADRAKAADLVEAAEAAYSVEAAETADLAETAKAADLAETEKAADLAEGAKAADVAEEAKAADLAEAADLADTAALEEAAEAADPVEAAEVTGTADAVAKSSSEEAHETGSAAGLLEGPESAGAHCAVGGPESAGAAGIVDRSDASRVHRPSAESSSENLAAASHEPEPPEHTLRAPSTASAEQIWKQWTEAAQQPHSGAGSAADSSSGSSGTSLMDSSEMWKLTSVRGEPQYRVVPSGPSPEFPPELIVATQLHFLQVDTPKAYFFLSPSCRRTIGPWGPQRFAKIMEKHETYRHLVHHTGFTTIRRCQNSLSTYLEVVLVEKEKGGFMPWCWVLTRQDVSLPTFLGDTIDLDGSWLIDSVQPVEDPEVLEALGLPTTD